MAEQKFINTVDLITFRRQANFSVKENARAALEWAHLLLNWLSYAGFEHNTVFPMMTHTGIFVDKETFGVHNGTIGASAKCATERQLERQTLIQMIAAVALGDTNFTTTGWLTALSKPPHDCLTLLKDPSLDLSKAGVDTFANPPWDCLKKQTDPGYDAVKAFLYTYGVLKLTPLEAATTLQMYVNKLKITYDDLQLAPMSPS